MKNLILIALASLLLAACTRDDVGQNTQAPQANINTKRSPQAGDVIGFSSTNEAHVWRGIPYAQAPVGDLRWRAPRPLSRWAGVKQTLEFGAACAQPTSQISGDSGDGVMSGSEDCLFLDIYAPQLTSEEARSANLPVMFWIHGGGNSIGTTKGYDASVLVNKENVIVITAQYRLGPFGWFYQPQLQRELDEEPVGQSYSFADRSGNYGTLDLIAALKWTQQNIAAFGGNADNITIFGESAGGRNVMSLLVSPLAKGLFHRAISQSGSAYFETLTSATETKTNNSQSITEHLVAEHNLQTVQQLRQLSPKQILAAYGETGGSGLITMPTVLYDGYVLPPTSSVKMFAKGDYNQVPTILGTNKDEQKLFQYLDPYYTDTWFGFWTRARDRDVYARDSDYQTLHWRLMGVEEPARNMRSSPVYTYRFDWDDVGTPLGMDFPFLFGAAHAFDIPFVFGGIGLGPLGQILDSTPNPQERTELSNTMMSYWANFARTGNPNSAGLPNWAEWNQSQKTLILDSASDGGVRLSNEQITVDELRDKLASDPSFTDKAQRCELYSKLQRRSNLLDDLLDCD